MSSTSYRPVQKSLHWLIFLLVLVCYALTYNDLFFPREDPGRAYAWWIHISLGLLLLALVALRIVTRLALGAPPLPFTMTRLEAFLAHAAHLLLYALLIAIPVLGVVLTWLRGDALSFFSLFTIPSPIAPDRDLAHLVKNLHELCAYGILTVAGLHAAAALWHHFIRRDNVLTRMLPGDGA